jgi:cell division protein FtsN
MEKTEKFFIFTWKELIVIVLLVLTLVGFFFTLGLHYGKKIGSPVEHAQSNEDAEKLEESPESLPPRETLEVGSQHEKTVGSDTIKEATKEEVAQTGVKIDQPKAVALPSEKVEAKHEEKNEAITETHSEVKVTFSVQLGSYATKKEAQQKVKAFAKKGIETEIHTAEVNHQTRFRVIIPGFKSKANADQRGKDLKHKHKIDSYIVIK